MVLAFTKSNQFYCSSLLKLQNQKMLSRTKFRTTTFCSFFKFLFSNNDLLKTNQTTNWLRIGSYLIFPPFLAKLTLALFFLWIGFGHIFLTKILLLRNLTAIVPGNICCYKRVYTKMCKLWVCFTYGAP